LASTRRMGSIESEKAIAMLDAAEHILREEGYGALTSRRVADYLGVKQRLVYYYFHTMEDLVLEAFRRLAVRDLRRLELAISADQPLQEIWDVCINTTDSRIISVFMALANQHEPLRDEVISFIEEARKVQIKALKRAMERSGIDTKELPPDAVALIGSSIALTLNRESVLGVKKGHAATRRVIKKFFEALGA